MTPRLTIECSDAHEYTVGGIQWPGVTSVINTVVRKQALEHWIGEVGNDEAERIRDKAATHGTLVHALAALVVQGIPSIAMGDEGPTQAQVQAFTSWYEEYVEEVHAVELKVAHPTWRYAGTLDLLVRLKGDKRPTLVDLKTGKAVWPEAKMQCIAYVRAAQEMGLLAEYGYLRKASRRGVLHIPRDADGPARFHEYRSDQADFQAFLSALYLYRWMKS